MQAFCAPVSVPLARTCGNLRDVCRPPLSTRCSRAPFDATPSRTVANTRSRRGTNAPQNSRRVPTYRKHQLRERKGPAFERESAQPQQQQHAASDATHAWKRPGSRRRQEITLDYSDIFVGEKLQGVVRNTVPHGVYVNVGTERDGLVHLRDMAVDFVHFPSDVVAEGDPVTVWVKYVDPAKKILGLTMVKPHLGFESRMKVTEVQVGGRYRGVVERVTNYGAYVDIGAERHAFLHVSALWGECQRDTLDYLRLGQKVWVHVAEVDMVKSHVRLWARAADGRQLSESNEVSHIYLRPQVVEIQQREVPKPTRRSWEPETVEDEQESSSEEEEQDESVAEVQAEQVVCEDDEFSFAEQMSEWAEDRKGGERNKIKGLEEIAHLFTEDTEFVTEEES